MPTQPKAQSRMPHRDESLEFRTGCKEFELIIGLWFDSFYLNFGFLISRYYVANTISAHFLFSAFYHGIFYFLKMKRNRKKEKKNAAKTIHAYKKKRQNPPQKSSSIVCCDCSQFVFAACFFFIAIIIFHFMLRNIHIKPNQQEEEDRTQLLADSRPFSHNILYILMKMMIIIIITNK